MATQLNIKDPETIALARTMAQRSGKSVTATIRDALEQVDAANAAATKARAEQILAALRVINPNPRELLSPEWRDKSSVEIANSIYNEDGSFAE
jgi:hypothetical protein